MPRCLQELGTRVEAPLRLKGWSCLGSADRGPRGAAEVGEALLGMFDWLISGD